MSDTADLRERARVARGEEEEPLATTRESYEHTLSRSFPMYKRSRTRQARQTRRGRGSEAAREREEGAVRRNREERRKRRWSRGRWAGERKTSRCALLSCCAAVLMSVCITGVSSSRTAAAAKHDTSVDRAHLEKFESSSAAASQRRDVGHCEQQHGESIIEAESN